MRKVVWFGVIPSLLLVRVIVVIVVIFLIQLNS